VSKNGPFHNHLTGGIAWWWCRFCGYRWEPDDRYVTIQPVPSPRRSHCAHPASALMAFPDQAVVRAAYALGGLAAVHVIERQLWDWYQLVSTALRDADASRRR
jgi:hypothetical protein